MHLLKYEKFNNRFFSLLYPIYQILWQAGEYRGATVSVPYAGDECFTNYGEFYVPDGITERVR
jgi:hypothetical protein